MTEIAGEVDVAFAGSFTPIGPKGLPVDGSMMGPPVFDTGVPSATAVLVWVVPAAGVAMVATQVIDSPATNWVRGQAMSVESIV